MDVTYNFVKGKGWVPSTKERKFVIYYRSKNEGGSWWLLGSQYDSYEEAQERVRWGEHKFNFEFEYTILNKEDGTPLEIPDD